MAKKLAMLISCFLPLLLFIACANAEILRQDGVVYNITKDAAYVAGYLPDADTLVWNSQINGLPVILDYANWGGQWPTSSPAAAVIVAEGVKEIPDEAFYMWDKMETLKLPDSLEVIGASAFYGDTALKEVVLPPHVRRVGNDAFGDCIALERVFIPASLTEWETPSFMGCEKLADIQVDAQNPLYASVEGALYSRDGTALYWYPEGRGSAYSIPEGTLKIDRFAFEYNDTLRSLTIPEGVTEIAGETFGTCTALETVNLPASMVDVDGAFTGYGPRSVFVAPGNAVYYSIEGSLFRHADNALLYHGQDGDLFYAVPEGTLIIDDKAFAHDDSLQCVAIPFGVTEVGAAAFAGCTALTRVALPVTVEQIGEYAFESCISLESIALPPALVSIGNGAFSNCTSLRSMAIPASVTSIGKFAFEDGDPRLVITAEPGTAGEIYLQEKYAEDHPKTVNIGVVNNPGSKDLLDVRAEPSAGAASFTKCANGTAVVILKDENRWLYVQLGEATGYMPTEFVLRWEGFASLYTPAWGKVKGELGTLVKVFSQPMEGTESWETLEGGQLVKILQTVGPYYQIDTEFSETAYVPTHFLSAVRLMDGSAKNSSSQRFGVVCNPSQRDRLHLRAEPSKSSKSLARFFNGTQVEILSEEGDWYRVRVAGVEGYMMKQYVDGIN